MTRAVSPSALAPRDPSLKATDASALRAIAQAAINVELFTLPLYMTALYSIQGMHPITGAGNDFYQGRLWPGAKTSAKPTTANEKAFNIIFSVFIQEMLHLQLASNMATAVGVSPTFTSLALQNAQHGWTCYGPTLTVIPHIIDLTDTTTYQNVKVNIGAVSAEQLELFMAIEQPEDVARQAIDPNKRDKYFPTVPFAGWTPEKGEMDLPMFGTIGWMYQCYYDYLSLKYSDGSSLWDYVYNASGQQNDLFNNFSFPGHPMREFPGFETTIALTYSDIAYDQMVRMMDAITDQGEGSQLNKAPNANLLQVVLPQYQPSRSALESDYPSYTDTGALAPSADAVARSNNDNLDHYERFREVAEQLLPQIQTWPQWLKQVGEWQPGFLVSADYDPNNNPYDLPTPEQIAQALNNLTVPSARAANYTLLSQAVVGAIAGITTVLDSYWNPKQGEAQVSFPFPSMVGSGDRMAICWAVFGQAPNLAEGLAAPDSGKLYHACQGLDLENVGNSCAAIEIFHTCRGSNQCRSQGGCGFVQVSSGKSGGGGGGCGAAATATAVSMRAYGGLCGRPPEPSTLYSAPSDNKCQTFGGCAVPISASQVFPNEGVMELFDFVGPKMDSVKIGTLPFGKGDKVHDIAYKAYAKVMENRGKTVPAEPPAPDDLRLAFPPST